MSSPLHLNSYQEFLADKGESLPEYSELSRSGTSNQPTYTYQAICIFERKTYVAEGRGGAKPKAKQNAAHNLLFEVLKVYKKSWGIV